MALLSGLATSRIASLSRNHLPSNTATAWGRAGCAGHRRVWSGPIHTRDARFGDAENAVGGASMAFEKLNVALMPLGRCPTIRIRYSSKSADH